MTAQTLPPAYQNHFKNAAKLFDAKDYKKALNSVEKILTHYPDHADSLALKGLLLKSMNPSDMDQCYSFIQLALKYSNEQSFMAWNVYGTLKRDDNDYEMAQKCFSNALRIDPTNLGVVNDLSHVQAQLRNYSGLVQSRNTLVQQKPQYWFYWIGAIVANHLAKNYVVALSLIDTFLKQYDSGVVNGSNHAMSKYELSELLLYKAMIMLETMDHKGCLKLLNITESFIRDRVSYLEYKGQCLVKLGRSDDAKKLYRELLSLNGENYAYWSRLQETCGLPASTTDCVRDDTTRSKLLAFYSDMKLEYPGSNAAKRIPLNILTGDSTEFASMIDQYVRPFLHSNVPSLFSHLKSLYVDGQKVQVIESVMKRIESSLESTSCFPDSNQVEPPTTLLWTYLYLAHHFDKIHQYSTALSYVNKAIEHTPTAVELYMCKARILKHCGNYNEAANQMDLARTMDMADRYLNTKATKYLNRADRTAEAEDTLYLFARDQEGRFNAVDMQAMRYEIDTGYSFMRQGKYGKALRWFSHVIAQFTEIRNDQFDFHGYCLRKYSMRSYIEMLRYMDSLESHDYYFKAATGMIKTYLTLYKQPELYTTDEGVQKNATQEEVDSYAQDKKKYKRPTSETAANATPAPNPQHDDPCGNQLLIKLRSEENAQQQNNLLNEADKLMKVLIEHCSDRVETHLLAAELYLTSERYLHTLKSLKEAKKIDASHPSLHYYTCQLFTELGKGKVAESMARLIKMQQSQLMQDTTDVTIFNEQCDKSDLSHVLSHVKVGLQVLGVTDQNDKYASLIVDKVRPSSSSSCKLSDLVESYHILKHVLKKESESETVMQRALEAYPSSNSLFL